MLRSPGPRPGVVQGRNEQREGEADPPTARSQKRVRRAHVSMRCRRLGFRGDTTSKALRGPASRHAVRRPGTRQSVGRRARIIAITLRRGTPRRRACAALRAARGAQRKRGALDRQSWSLRRRRTLHRRSSDRPEHRSFCGGAMALLSGFSVTGSARSEVAAPGICASG
jgi:hypothetical protein